MNPAQCGGRPCIRGIRIRVTNGLTAVEILDEMSDVEADDIKAAVAYARRRVDHPVLATA